MYILFPFVCFPNYFSLYLKLCVYVCVCVSVIFILSLIKLRIFICECSELELLQTSMNVSASLDFVVEVNALTLQEAISVNVLLAMSLLQIRRRVKVLGHLIS